MASTPIDKERRAQLERKVRRPLTTALRKLLAVPDVSTIDIEMYWPPDDDAIHFQMSVDTQDANWDFSIPTAHWRLATDKADIPNGLHADIQHLFREVWQKAINMSSKPRAYLRLHDSTWSIDLRSGRKIDDRERPGYLEPERVPFNKTTESTPKGRRNGELVRRGDALAKVKKAYQISDEPDSATSQYFWPQHGIRIKIDKGKVQFVAYFAPFQDCVCGAWIGAHAWEVNQCLGRAKAESFSSAGRLWQYDVDGFLSVGFDRQDRVSFIGR